MNETAPAPIVRIATRADLDALRALMDASISGLLPKFYTPKQTLAAREFMGLDTQLIDDGSYFVVQAGPTIIGSGGWSWRATLFGGDASPGRSAAILDAERDAARIRAMYTHPSYARLGVGRRILNACEEAAASIGFRRAELAATLAGEPFYRANGYEEIERFDAVAKNGVAVPMARMGKSLRARA